MAYTQTENDGANAQPVLSVSDLTAQIKETLEGTFPDVWVTGEISNLSRPQSGHCYLTLKDDRAQIRAVMWRATAARVRFDLHDGLEVVCQGYVDVYAQRGSYQLVVQQVQPKGMGALELALRQLMEKLKAEGLFEAARKRPLPRFPRRVAVVTSPTGAAIRDFLEVLRRRWRGVDVVIVPVRVQGDGAATEIAEAIELVNRFREPVDVLVVTRGGGSLEDLWAFNEEPVARAIFASQVPVISAVGHEIDVTVADLVADVRALTPSEAAERLAPAAEELTFHLNQIRARLAGTLRARVRSARTQLDWIAGRRAFLRPLDRLRDMARRLDELQARAGRAVRSRADRGGQHMARLAAQLESLSPLSVLGRGYSLTERADDGRLVRDANTLAAGDRLVTRFARGRATSRVEQIDDVEIDLDNGRPC